MMNRWEKINWYEFVDSQTDDDLVGSFYPDALFTGSYESDADYWRWVAYNQFDDDELSAEEIAFRCEEVVDKMEDKNLLRRWKNS